MSSSPTPVAPIPTAPQSTGRPGLPNLTAIIDAKTSTPREVQVATGQRIAREFKAYGYLSAEANVSGDARAYLKAYLKYYDSLSSAEQQTARYRGTREGALKGLAEQAAPPTYSAQAPTPEITNVAFTQQNGGGWSPFPSADLLGGLRALLGVIEQTRHPGPAPHIAIKTIDYKA